MGLDIVVGLVFLGLLIWAIAGTLAKRRGQMNRGLALDDVPNGRRGTQS